MSDASNPTRPMRDGEELDAAAVDALVRDHVPGLEGALELRQFEGGHSNLTYLLSYANRQLVLRRPPTGTRPKSGHSMIREYRVMNALRPVFPAVPETLFHVDDDASPFGAECYVMERVPGRKIGRDLPPDWRLDAAGTRRLGFGFFDQLIALHGVDPAAAGLSDFGRPAGYLERQVLGWNKRYEAALTDDADRYDDVRDWLAEHLPVRDPDTEVAGAAVLHGDFRLDNAIFDEDDPTCIRAILDWEISALGDPLMDLGNTLAYWVEANDPPGMLDVRMQPSNAPGMPTRAELLSHYARATGRDVSGFDYFLIAGLFRLAAVLQQIYYRYYHGESRNPAFAQFDVRIAALGGRCRELIARADA